MTLDEARRKTAANAPVVCCQVESNLNVQEFSATQIVFVCGSCGRTHRRMAAPMSGLLTVGQAVAQSNGN